MLIQGVKDSDAQTVMGIGISLGRIGHRKAIPALMSLFHRKDALEPLASNPRNLNLATVAHYALSDITREQVRLPKEEASMGAIVSEDQLIAVRNSWQEKYRRVNAVESRPAGERN